MGENIEQDMPTFTFLVLAFWVARSLVVDISVLNVGLIGAQSAMYETASFLFKDLGDD
jgi:hypothetical protein